MSASMVCPHCGHVNARVGVFCAKCGEKMGAGAIHREARRASGGWLSTALRWIVSLVLIGLIALLFWPQHVPQVRARAEAGRAVAARIAQLRHAAETGTPAGDVFSQEDVNAYLAWRLAESPESGRFGASLERMYAVFNTPECSFRVLNRLGPLRLSFTLNVRPVSTGNRGRFDVTGAAIGHVPMPKPIVPWVAGKMAHVFADMEDERVVSSHIRRVECREGLLGVAVGTQR